MEQKINQVNKTKQIKKSEELIKALENKPQRIVINVKHGGFGLSWKALQLYGKLIGKPIYSYIQTKYSKNYLQGIEDGQEEYVRIDTEEEAENAGLTRYDLTKDLGKKTNTLGTGKEQSTYWFHDDDIARDDPILIQVVEKLKDKANGQYSKLKIVDVPYGVKWEIGEYDGWETVEEVHRSWN